MLRESIEDQGRIRQVGDRLARKAASASHARRRSGQEPGPLRLKANAALLEEGPGADLRTCSIFFSETGPGPVAPGASALSNSLNRLKYRRAYHRRYWSAALIYGQLKQQT